MHFYLTFNAKKDIVNYMIKLIQEKTLIKIGAEPMVILPLKQWEAMKELFEDLKNKVRFNKVYQETRGQKTIGLETLKKKYNLK